MPAVQELNGHRTLGWCKTLLLGKAMLELYGKSCLVHDFVLKHFHFRVVLIQASDLKNVLPRGSLRFLYCKVNLSFHFELFTLLLALLEHLLHLDSV